MPLLIPQFSKCALSALIIWCCTVGAAYAYLSDEDRHAPDSLSGHPAESGQTFDDPAFGTSIKRLSDAVSTPNSASGGSLDFVMAEYSTMTPFSHDNTRLILQHDSYYGLYDGEGDFIRDLPFEISAPTEPRWSRSDPRLLYFVRGNRLKSHHVDTGVTSIVRTFSEYTNISGKGESDISLDGDHFVFIGGSRQIFVYEISSDTKGEVLNTGGRGLDSIYITPDGNVTVTWLQAGTGRYKGIELYDRNMSFLRQATRAGGHMDVGRDGNGDEVLLWANAADPLPQCPNAVVKVRLSDGHQTCLISLDWSLAVNVSATDNSGWVYVATYAPTDPDPDSADWVPYTNEILQVAMDGSGTRRLAHHGSRPFNEYNYTPRPSVSRDGSKLVFGSNFGVQVSGDSIEYSDAYLIDLSSLVANGYYVLDRFGGVYAGGGAAIMQPATPYWGFDVASDLELAPIGYYVLDRVGGVHAGGGAPIMQPATPYWGFDVAADLELASTGYYVLDRFGGVHAGGGAPALQPRTPYWGFDVAADLELASTGYYVLDRFGGVHAGGGAPVLKPATPYWGFDVAADLELASTGYYVLDRFGGVHAGGGAPVLSPTTPYWGFDVAADLELASTGYYVLDGFGGVHAGGGAPIPSPATPYWGFDVAADLELR